MKRDRCDAIEGRHTPYTPLRGQRAARATSVRAHSCAVCNASRVSMHAAVSPRRLPQRGMRKCGERYGAASVSVIRVMCVTSRTATAAAVGAEVLR